MPVINNATREIICKLVYYGPALGGKTTNLRYIHNSLPPTQRGELISLATQQDRTLFFDFMPLDLGKIKDFNIKFALYTVPGQVFYNATRRLVLRGVDGIVFVADSQLDRIDENVDSLENMCENLTFYDYDIEEIPWVIQYNKRDLPNIAPVELLQQKLNFFDTPVPYFESVAINGTGVKETLKKIVSLVLKKIESFSEQTMLEPPAVLLKKRQEVNALETASVDSSLSSTATAVTPSPNRKNNLTDEEKTTTQKQIKPSSTQETKTKIFLRQVANIIGLGITLGKARLQFDTRENLDGKGDYQLIVRCKFLSLFNYYFIKLFNYERTISLNINGKMQEFMLYREQIASPAKTAQHCSLVWIKQGGPPTPIYCKCVSRLGVFYLVPEQDKIFLKYLV